MSGTGEEQEAAAATEAATATATTTSSSGKPAWGGWGKPAAAPPSSVVRPSLGAWCDVHTMCTHTDV